MKFTLENQAHYAIHGYEPGEINVAIAEENAGAPNVMASKKLTRPFILSAETLHEDWQHSGIKDSLADDFDLLLQYEPEVVILCTGSRIIFPSPDALTAFYSRNIGVEVMDTGAACRTFNVLASEYRKVIAGFMEF